MFHLSWSLCSGDKPRKEGWIQILLQPHTHIILSPLMQGEIREIYSPIPYFWRNRECIGRIAGRLWFQLDQPELFVQKGEMFAACFLPKRLTGSCVFWGELVCKVLNRGSHFCNKKRGLTTCRNTWTNTSTSEALPNQTSQVYLLWINLSVMWNEFSYQWKNNKCTIMRKWPNGPRQINLICY